MERANIVLALSILCVFDWGIYSGLLLRDAGGEGMVVPVTPAPGLIGSDRALKGGVLGVHPPLGPTASESRLNLA